MKRNNVVRGRGGARHVDVVVYDNIAHAGCSCCPSRANKTAKCIADERILFWREKKFRARDHNIITPHRGVRISAGPSKQS